MAGKGGRRFIGRSFRQNHKAMKTLELADFPAQAFDTIRYSDTDRQGHVNNAVFATFLETGRVAFLYNKELPVLREGASFVIAALQMSFLQELHWPGRVEIGSGILKLGNSSVKLWQQLHQNGQCVAQAETVIVQVDDASGKSTPLTPEAREILSPWLLPGAE